MDARILERDIEVELARALLYSVYVAEYGWQPSAKNPSGIRVEQTDHRMVMTDSYDSIAKWIGVFQDDSLIGCCRVCEVISGPFELELYTQLPPEVASKDRKAEVTRVALKPGRRAKLSGLLCIITQLCHLASEGTLLFGATAIKSLRRTYVKLGVKEISGSHFKYPMEDDYATCFMIAPGTHSANVARRCQHLLVDLGISKDGDDRA